MFRREMSDSVPPRVMASFAKKEDTPSERCFHRIVIIGISRARCVLPYYREAGGPGACHRAGPCGCAAILYSHYKVIGL